MKLEEILNTNPFEGDFGSCDDVVLTNKIVKASKEHECSHCKTTIKKGDRYRSYVGKWDGDLQAYRFCEACCMAWLRDSEQQDGEGADEDELRNEYENRYGIGLKQAKDGKGVAT